MTLVVSDVAANGFVLVGDSAVTVTRGGITRVLHGASKVHYSSDANVGFAVWGNACLAGRRVDDICAEVSASLDQVASPSVAASRLADELNASAAQDGRPWDVLRGGVHVSGYEDGVPVLFHLHTGGDGPQHPCSLSRDFPDGRAGAHLRNGYYRVFAALFESMGSFIGSLRSLGMKWPTIQLEDRLRYYDLHVRIVSDVVVSTSGHPHVDTFTSAVAFDASGLRIGRRSVRSTRSFCSDPSTLAES